MFLEAVSQKATQSDVTWQAILRAFLFQPEAQRISACLNEYDNELAAEKKREVRLALQMNECQFDSDTVNEYLREEHKESILGAAPEENF